MGEQGYNYTKPRGKVGAMYSSPGPIYRLKPLTGEYEHDVQSVHTKAPSYTLAKRLKYHDEDRSPGPAAYEQNRKLTNIGEAYSPKYTAAGMLNSIGNITGGPSPAEYNIKSGIKHVYPTSPSHHIGMRTGRYLLNDNPAPNAYMVPPPAVSSQTASQPKYTMAGRGESILIINKNPGPADYALGNPDIVLDSSPKHTMGIKLKEPNLSEYPGPLTYKHENVYAHIKSAPRFTMGIKHSEYKGEFDKRQDDDYC